MAKEKLPDGRIITGGPTNVKGNVNLNVSEIKALKEQMYQDFLLAKQEGKVTLEYTFDSWLRDSINMLRNVRQADIVTEYKLGKISKSEYDALEEMRVKMISAIIRMDIRDLDKYGIQHLDPSIATVRTGGGLLLPDYRKNKVKFNKNVIH